MFAPKFDVKELPDSYKLKRELLAIEQKDIKIEFSNKATLTICSKIKRSYTTSTPPARFVEGPVS